MSTSKQNIDTLLELANLYPSPHNGQPIRLKQRDDDSFDLYFERERGLQAADVSFIFSFVTMGVFVEHLALSAEALGHSFTFHPALPKESSLRGQGVVTFGQCHIGWNAQTEDGTLQKTLRFRQTSRKKYHEGVDHALAESLRKLAADSRMNLHELKKPQSKQAIWLNQRAVFDDMFDEPVRQELNHWLRYSKREKQAKKDGLSYDCMELNGHVLKYVVDHPKILRAPGISELIKQYYLRTMTDSSDVFYMLAPFGTEQHAYEVGVVIMKIWKAVAEHGLYLHPFGTIMSNHAAHHDFVKLADIQNETRDNSYLVFIFRCGKSETPTPSLRIPYNEHLMME